ncbi:MAG: AAA family ATPase [Lewinellaceae bacterium]|nr:AAA family ATPase [Lewinellaceae bacterium]
MKINSLSLRNFKRFSDREFNFCDDEGKAYGMILLVGENGSGKSSLLQAIAMLLGAAFKPFTTPSSLKYPGFYWDNIQSGRMPVDVRAAISMSKEEIDATLDYYQQLQERFREAGIKPGTDEIFELFLDYRKDRVQASTSANFFQTKGYEYALQLSKFVPNFERLFEKVGSIYKYDEHRNAASLSSTQIQGLNGKGKENETNGVFSEKQLKEVLFKWYVFHQNVANKKFRLREGQRDFFADFERLYQQVFPNRTFKGFAPKMEFEDFFDQDQDFWLFDGKNDYEFSELSGGERAIFPILLDFANRIINHSIILIDEVELHLHPPLQQALIRALPKLGKNNQFILTTHSESVAAMFTEPQIIRLDG